MIKITQYDFLQSDHLLISTRTKISLLSNPKSESGDGSSTKISPTFSEFRRNRVDALGNDRLPPPAGLEVGLASGKWVPGRESNYANM